MLDRTWCLLVLLVLFARLVSSTPNNRTLVMVKYGGKALDSRQLPNMMARAFGTARRLTDEDRIYENCLLEDGMVEDLSAIGVQIISSKCQATSAQMASYLRKANDALNVVSFVEPDREVFLHTAPGHTSLRRAQLICPVGPNPRLGTNDPLSLCQPGLELINISRGWEFIGTPLKEVVVAIIDSGVDTKHPDLINQLWRNPKDGSVGYNFITNTNDPTDDNGHGTRCAGVIAAETNNNIGVASVAGVVGVKVMALKSFDIDGIGADADILRALNFAVENGAQVSLHSYASDVHSELERQAFANAVATGHVIAVGAGNSGRSVDEHPSYPCLFASDIPSMLCVAATTSGPSTPVTLASFSDYGSAVNIAAPGVGILTTGLGGYERYSATSMATSYVAGVAAILASLGLEGRSITSAIVRYGGKVDNSDIPLLNA